MHTNRRLFDLATKNAQSAAIKDFLSEASQDVRELFDPAVRIFHPELSERLADIVSRANQLQDGKLQVSSNIKVQRTSSRQKAMDTYSDILRSLPIGRYLLVVGGGNGTTFDGASYWVSNQPGHYVSLPEANPQIAELLQSSINEFVLAVPDGEAALVLETVGGYLPEEPSPDEVIFEVSAWLPHA